MSALAPALQAFFTDRLITQRNCSPQTIAAYRDTFTLAFRAPEELGVLPFKVIQGCETGENAWIEEWDGTGEEPESPAPSVEVVAAAAGEGDEHGEEATETTVASSNGETWNAEERCAMW